MTLAQIADSVVRLTQTRKLCGCGHILSVAHRAEGLATPMVLETWFLVTILLLTLVVPSSCVPPGGPPPGWGSNDATVEASLIALYLGSGGAGWTNNTGWAGSDSYCDWFGVHCYKNAAGSTLMNL